MAKLIPAQIFDDIIEVLGRFPEGASIEQIAAALAFPPNRRTLQRRLTELVVRQRLRREGAGRGTRYRRGTIIVGTGTAVIRREATAQAGILIPLSAEAQAVEAHVRQPVQLRRPVGYNRAFAHCLSSMSPSKPTSARCWASTS